MKISFNTIKKNNPGYEGGMKIPYAPAKRAKAVWKWYVIVLITASPLLFFLGKILISYILVSAPGIVSFREIKINSPETASISKIYIKKGDKIKKGTLLADLSDPAIEDQLSFLNYELESLGRKKPINMASDRMEANVMLAQKILDSQTAYLGKIRYLFAKGAATAAELNLATSQHNQAQLEAFRARADYTASRIIKPDTVAESRIERLKKEIETIGGKRIRLEFKSPVSGIVSELYVFENQSIAKGAQFARISIPEEYSIRAYIKPSNIRLARKGKNVTMRMPGNILLNGYIASDPESARIMPRELSDSFYDENRQAIEINIITSSPLPREYQIDGLPIKVYFGFPFI